MLCSIRSVVEHSTFNRDVVGSIPPWSTSQSPPENYFWEVSIVGNFPVIDMRKTGQNITRLRKQAGLTVQNLQDAFGSQTPQAIYKWQRGAALPTIDNLLILSTLFQTRIDDILVTNNN